MQDNDFRSATNLRALARSRSDNTFSTAINLGRVSPNANRVTFRASGTVGRSDKVDFYKLTFDPGVSLQGNARYGVRNGSATFSLFNELQGNRRIVTEFTLRRNSSTPNVRAGNPSQFPIAVYLKVERPTGRTRYNFAFNYFR